MIKKVLHLFCALAFLSPTMARAAAFELGHEALPIAPVAPEILPAMPVNELGTVPNYSDSLESPSSLLEEAAPQKAMKEIGTVPNSSGLHASLVPGVLRGDAKEKGTVPNSRAAGAQLQKLSALPSLSAGNVFDGSRFCNHASLAAQKPFAIPSSPTPGLKILKTIALTAPVLNGFRLSPDGKFISGVTHEDKIWSFAVWNADTGALVSGPYPYSKVNYFNHSLGQSGRTLVSIKSKLLFKSSASIWTIKKGRLEPTAVFKMPHIAFARLSDNEKRLLLGYDGEAVVYDIATRQMIGKFSYESENEIALDPQGEKAAVSKDGILEILDIASGNILHSIPHGSSSLSFSPDGRFILASEEGHFALFDSKTGARLLNRYVDHVSEGPFASFSGDGKRLALSFPSLWASNDILSVYDLESMKLLDDFRLEWPYKVRHIAMNQDGTRVFSESGSKIHIFEIPAQKSSVPERIAQVAEELSRREVVPEEKSENSSSKKEKSAEEIFRIWPDFGGVPR